MPKTKQKRLTHSSNGGRSNRPKPELDSVYVLKLVMYLIVGTLWVRIGNSSNTNQIPIPAGLIIGFIFAMHEHFRIDRRIEYAVLLVAMFVGFWTQVGLVITY
jgi:hypothetical protein